MEEVKAVMIYVTTGTRDEALALSHRAVEEKLAACGNVIEGMTSVFSWQGSVCSDTETVLILKSTSYCLQPLVAMIREHHSYEAPCILAIPVVGGNPEFLHWISDSCPAGE